ncbi:MAG: acyl-CoA dehydrogenase [Steroidobacteraceae bacterium]|nr:acyl-CoA dehydrogenase [Steroidobacteraceae bacterium]
MLLFNPAAYDAAHYDGPTRRALLAVRRFFEAKGHAVLKAESHDATWYDDFLEMIARDGVFARFGTPAAVGTLTGGSDATTARWDTARNNDLSQLLAWYSLEHWYAWQVTVLGLGPVWTSGNAEAKRLVGQLLAQGGLFAFGLSEREHGADIYSTDMVLTQDGTGWRASGEKYYIGNGNCAARVSVFGRVQRPEGPSANPADDYLFFLADPKHAAYTLVQNVVHGQMYVSEFRLTDYPVTPADVLHKGKAAWDAALATVNVGKVQLAWASIGIAEHAFVEAIQHAHRRVLYGTRVTDFPHVRRLLADAYIRLVAMKLYSARCSDYERSASPEDRRFLLYNPIAKMKVTSEGERVVDLLWEVIAAKGFEKDTYFEQATRHIRTLPKLEGTVHVNLALVLKFLPAFAAAGAGQGVKYPPVPVRLDPADDTFLFAQGPASGLSRIGFPDWRGAFARFSHLPNVATFIGQVQAFGQLMATAAPRGEQAKDLDFLLNIGQIFTQIVYAQLAAEAAALAIDGAPGGTRAGTTAACTGLDEKHVDRMFGVFVQDLSEYAVAVHGQASATREQQAGAMALIHRAAADPATAARLHAEVVSYAG